MAALLELSHEELMAIETGSSRSQRVVHALEIQALVTSGLRSDEILRLRNFAAGFADAAVDLEDTRAAGASDKTILGGPARLAAALRMLGQPGCDCAGAESDLVAAIEGHDLLMRSPWVDRLRNCEFMGPFFESGPRARYHLALLLLSLDPVRQSARIDSLLHDLGFKFKLHPDCFRPQSKLLVPSHMLPPPATIARVYDDVLPEPCLQILRDDLFGTEESSFFGRVGYKQVNHYFSFWHPLDTSTYGAGAEEQSAPANAATSQDSTPNIIDTLVRDHILPRMQRDFAAILGDRAVGVEWWAHQRSPDSGHQMHFDCDERALLCGRGLCYPIVSCVLYLCGGSGAQTLICDRRFQDERGAAGGGKGWLCAPKANRLLAFDGRMLHGVPPCCNPKQQSVSQSLRTTLMVGIWGRDPTELAPDALSDSAEHSLGLGLGPCRPLPTQLEDLVCGPRAVQFAASSKAKPDAAPVVIGSSTTDGTRLIEPLWVPVHCQRKQNVNASETVNFVSGFFLRRLKDIDANIKSTLERQLEESFRVLLNASTEDESLVETVAEGLLSATDAAGACGYLICESDTRLQELAQLIDVGGDEMCVECALGVLWNIFEGTTSDAIRSRCAKAVGPAAATFLHTAATGNPDHFSFQLVWMAALVVSWIPDPPVPLVVKALSERLAEGTRGESDDDEGEELVAVARGLLRVLRGQPDAASAAARSGVLELAATLA